jgi:hypothetical protein
MENEEKQQIENENTQWKRNFFSVAMLLNLFGTFVVLCAIRTAISLSSVGIIVYIIFAFLLVFYLIIYGRVAETLIKRLSSRNAWFIASAVGVVEALLIYYVILPMDTFIKGIFK